MLANRQAYEPLCDKYGKNTVDFLISSGKDAGLSLIVLGGFGIMKALNDHNTANAEARRFFDGSLYTAVFVFSLVNVAIEAGDLLSPAMQEACKQTGYSCGGVGDLLIFALPAIVVLPGLINNYISARRERKGKVKRS